MSDFTLCPYELETPTERRTFEKLKFMECAASIYNRTGASVDHIVWSLLLLFQHKYGKEQVGHGWLHWQGVTGMTYGWKT